MRRCVGDVKMAWKKAWPQQVKDTLKQKYGLSDSKIRTLESYGSLEDAAKDLAAALGDAKANEVKAQLKDAGLW
jgi:hypothetical protein